MLLRWKRPITTVFTRFSTDQRGSIIAVAALGMGVILAMAAFVIDAGLLYLTRAQLSRAADASVLAAVQELPSDRAMAESIARDYAMLNGVPEAPEGEISVDISDDNREIRVAVRKTVRLLFARLLGFSQSEVRARAAARIGPVRAMKGAAPFGVEGQNFVYGELYTLKEKGGDGEWGNYGALALGGSGGNIYRDNIMYGYQGELHIGDEVETEPGNMSGPTRQGVEYRMDLCRNRCHHECSWDDFAPGCPRLIYVPIVTEPSHGRSTVTIVGFAAFFLEGVGGRGGGHAEVYGRFIRMVTEGEYGDGGDYGLQAYRLIE